MCKIEQIRRIYTTRKTSIVSHQSQWEHTGLQLSKQQSKCETDSEILMVQTNTMRRMNIVARPFEFRFCRHLGVFFPKFKLTTLLLAGKKVYFYNNNRLSKMRQITNGQFPCEQTKIAVITHNLLKGQLINRHFHTIPYHSCLSYANVVVGKKIRFWRWLPNNSKFCSWIEWKKNVSWHVDVE